MTRPRLLDLFCCGGGAGMGYHQAGFDVVGVDIVRHDDYPFEFIQMDAIHFAMRYARSFDVIHASPPCQSQTMLMKGTNKGKYDHPNLIPATRAVLAHLRVPTIIENVQSSEVRPDLTLCGEMFGLGVIRHRHFEIENAVIPRMPHVKHRGTTTGWRHGKWQDGPYLQVYGTGGSRGSVADWQRAMGIDWIDNKPTLAEAIPPAYTRYIGQQLWAYCGYNKTHDQADTRREADGAHSPLPADR